MSETTKWLYDRFAVILTAAMDGKADLVADTIAEVGRTEGHDGVYAICCGMAQAVMRLGFPEIQQGDGTLTGDMMIVDKMPGASDDPAALWACRFVAAHVNGDRERCGDLFFVPIATGDDAIIGNVVALVIMTADLARTKETELAAQADPTQLGEP